MELLAHLPQAAILDAYAKAAGRELDGKANSPESSSALVANTLGYFLDRPSLLPPLPGLENAGWPALSVALEVNVRFPWPGGRHPWLDALVETSTHTIGIESKRFEPYRGRYHAQFSQTYERDVWVRTMVPYIQLMAELRLEPMGMDALDAGQLIKHALALSTQCAKTGKQPVLYYRYADPRTWADGRAITDAQRAKHADDLAVFARRVVGAHVRFVAATYAEILETWRTPDLCHHADAVSERFL